MSCRTCIMLVVLLVMAFAFYLALGVNSIDVMETLKQHNPLASEQ